MSFASRRFPGCAAGRPSWMPRDARQLLGRSLARVHQIGALRPFGPVRRIGLQRLGIDACNQVLASDLLPDVLRDRYVDTSEALLGRVEQRSSRPGPLREIRIHGDCHLGNLLWNEQGPAFVDLDDCATGPRVQDLWMLLAGSRSDQRRQWARVVGGLHPVR